MNEYKYEDVIDFPCVNLIRGLKMTYKGQEMYFPKVYMGESEMDDFDTARASIEYKEAAEDDREQVAIKKTMTLCSRLLLEDGFAVEEKEIQEKYALRERKRVKVVNKIKKVEDEVVKAKLEKELSEIPSLEKPKNLFPMEQKVLTFSISNLGKGVRPVDNIRLIQAFSVLNMFEQEEVEDFLDYKRS